MCSLEPVESIGYGNHLVERVFSVFLLVSFLPSLSLPFFPSLSRTMQSLEVTKQARSDRRGSILTALVLASLVGWCTYLTVHVHTLSTGPDAPVEVSKRVTTLSSTLSSALAGLQVTFNAEQVFAFADVQGMSVWRSYIPPNTTLVHLPDEFLPNVTYGANTAYDEELFYPFYTVAVANNAVRRAFLSESLTLFCSDAIDGGRPEPTAACTRLNKPSCTYLNMIQHDWPNGYGDIHHETVLLAVSYLACTNSTTP